MTDIEISPDPPRHPAWRLLTLFGQALAVLVLIMLALRAWNAWDLEAFMSWMQEAGAIPFFVALALLPAIGFPTTPFYLLAGASFGSVVGLLGSAASLAVNLLLCYWLTHSGLRPLLERWLAKTRYRIPRVKPGNEVRFTVVTKLIPGVPAFIKNYIICLSGVPFGVYFGLSFLITMGYAAAFIVLGESVYEQDFGKGAWALGLLIVLIVILRFVRKRSRLKEIELTRA